MSSEASDASALAVSSGGRGCQCSHAHMSKELDMDMVNPSRDLATATFVASLITQR